MPKPAKQVKASRKHASVNALALLQNELLSEGGFHKDDLEQTQHAALLLLFRIVFTTHLWEEREILSGRADYFLAPDSQPHSYAHSDALNQLFHCLYHSSEFGLQGCELFDPKLDGRIGPVRLRGSTLSQAIELARRIVKKNSSFGDFYQEILEAMTAKAANEKELDTKKVSSTRKQRASYYTPSYIIRFMIEQSFAGVIARQTNVRCPQEILQLKVIDPAMGAGSFIVGALDYLTQCYTNSLIAQGEEREVLQPENVVLVRRKIVQHCLYGVDLDPYAVLLSKMAIWLSTLVPGRPALFLQHRLKQGNSLLGAAVDIKQQTKAVERLAVAAVTLEKIADTETVDLCCLQTKEKLFAEAEKTVQPLKQEADQALFRTINDSAVSCFHWHLEFPEVWFSSRSKSSGFDICIGNPPYQKIEEVVLKKWLTHRGFRCPKNNWDKYAAFVETTYELLAPVGTFSLIVPNTFTIGPWFREMRGFLSEKGFVSELFNFGRHSIFPGATAFVCIICGSKSKSLTLNQANIASIEQFKKRQFDSTQVQYSQVGDDIWAVKDEVCTQMDQSGQPFREFCDCFDSGLDYNKAEVAGRVFYSGSRENPGDILYLRGCDISPFKISPGRRWLRQNWPELLDRTRKERLKVNSKAYCDRPKLLSRQTSDRLIFAVDERGFYLQKSLHSSHLRASTPSVNPYFLVAVLNSPAATHYYRCLTVHEVNKPLSQIKIDRLKRIPIPKLSKEEIEAGNRLIEKSTFGLTEPAIANSRAENYALIALTAKSLSSQPYTAEEFKRAWEKANELVMDLFGFTKETRARIKEYFSLV